jgi:hypothetical protein
VARQMHRRQFGSCLARGIVELHLVERAERGVLGVVFAAEYVEPIVGRPGAERAYP